MSETRQTKTESYEESCVRSLRNGPPPVQQPTPSANAAVARSMAAMFGLDPRAALLIIIVDVMMLAMDVISAGAFIVVGIAIAAYVAFLTYKMQRKFFGDDHDASLIKAMIVGLLMAIPVPITPILAVVFGITGTIQLARRR